MSTINVVRVIAGLRAIGILFSHWRRYQAVIISIAFHTVVLVGMASFVFHPGTAGKTAVITLHATDGADAIESSVDLVEEQELAVVLEPAPADATASESLADVPYVAADQTVVTELGSVPPSAPTLPPLSALMATAPTRPLVKPARTLVQVASTQAATAVLAQDVTERLQQRDVLVVWLVDASHSVVDNRAQLLAGFESFFLRVNQRAGDPHRLRNAVVSYGSAGKEQVAPTESHDQVLAAIRGLTADDSGTENTFAAIEKFAIAYRADWPDLDLLLVVWTDESGNDAQRLEQTIEVCREIDVAVSVVGPVAVLGGGMAAESFVDSVSGETLRLPVNRGPDSAAPERIELGYWFLTQDPRSMPQAERGFRLTGLPSWFASTNRAFGDHQCIAATEVALPAWYGGDDLTGLVSGFGPYALTRLAAQTTGVYVMLADAIHRGPFQNAALQDYRPDYRAVDVVSRDVESKPLRRAVVEAVRIAHGKKLGPPPTMLFGKRSEKPPFGFMRSYLTPRAFVTKLKAVRPRLKTQASRTLDAVEQTLAAVSQPGTLDVGLEAEYEQETSRRWRAWYDLTRGRLLATSVRLAEYRKTCDTMVEPGSIKPKTNFAVFAPSLQLRSSSKYRFRAEEAERLLLRCVRENPNTPWALLAQRELDFALGMEVRQFTTSLVYMKPGSEKRVPTPPKL